jgi:hypothetical protein
MKKEKITICLIAAVLFITAGQGFGWTQFNNGGTQDVNYQLNDDVWVDYYQAPFMQTIVNLLKGGNIPSPYTLQGFNNSRINISGGTINYLQIYNSSQVTMSSGTVNYLQTYNSSQVTMSGGTVNYLQTYGSSQVTMSGGTVNDMQTNDSSHVTMSGGQVSKNFSASGSSQITISGGTIGGGFLLGTSANSSATLIIHGSNFAIDGRPVSSGKIISIISIFGGGCENEPHRRLTGTLANGDIINSQVKIGYDAKIFLVRD